MGDEAHVGFVDAHAKGDGGHHDDTVCIDETTLVFGARRLIEAGMIGQRGDALRVEPFGGFIHLTARQAVDDAGFTGVFIGNKG